MNELLLRRRQMVVGGDVDIYTFLRNKGCIAWFPLAYEGDYTDVIGGLTLTSVVASRMTWDADRGMYLVNCIAQNNAAIINLGNSIFFTQGTTYGVMAQAEHSSGTSIVASINWNDSSASNSGLSITNTFSWNATFVTKSGTRYFLKRFRGDETIETNKLISFNNTFTYVGLGRNSRYQQSGNAYVRDLLFFNKSVSFDTYQTIKARIESERQ